VGQVDCHLYRQPTPDWLAIVNSAVPARGASPSMNLIPIGSLTGKVKLPGDVAGNKLRLLVSAKPVLRVSLFLPPRSGAPAKDGCILRSAGVVDNEVNSLLP